MQSFKRYQSNLKSNSKLQATSEERRGRESYVSSPGISYKPSSSILHQLETGCGFVTQPSVESYSNLNMSK